MSESSLMHSSVLFPLFRVCLDCFVFVLTDFVCMSEVFWLGKEWGWFERLRKWDSICMQRGVQTEDISPACLSEQQARVLMDRGKRGCIDALRV
mmetsp:Transcript_6226/g.12303  ORF Transcript_6226/g.12303 Transcript_6226/m.12303 type:complete len:94 (-) Transcript_6226:629-910(-)